ncbi:MAG: hypothetical protein EP332_13070 [Bacteroidetes bacterium]|nr:MAG: hypothetical protein EP332_13070 [Bacteroidota bacterium]
MTKSAFTGVFEEIQEGIGGNRLVFNASDIEGHGWKGLTRIVMHLPNGEALQRAVRPNKVGQYFITITNAYQKKLGWQHGMEVTVQLEADTSEYQMNSCEEFEEVMAQDPEAKDAFDALTPGKRRGLLHHISSAKSSQVRINRALNIAERVKNGEWK